MDENNQPIVPVVAQEDQVTTPTEEPTYSHEDIQKESFRDIATNTEEPKPVETPQAPVIPPEEPEVPLEEVASKIAEDAAKKVLEDQRKQFEANEEEIKKQNQIKEDAAKPQEDRRPIWVQEGREPKDYTEIYKQAQKDSEYRMKDILTQQENDRKLAEQTKQTELAQEQARQDENKKNLDVVINDELEDLYKANMLTRVKDEGNPSDQGRIERQALFAKWAEVNQERRAKGLPDIVSATRIFNFYFTKPTAQPAGADAPVMGNKGSATPPSSEKDYSYDDIKKPWSWFKRG